MGVTPSTISQVESNLIYPSLPALLKMAEVLCVDVSSFFQETPLAKRRLVFSSSDATEVRLSELPDGTVYARMLTPVDVDVKAEPLLLEIPPDRTISSHFFMHKGEEMGYMLSGELQVKVGNDLHALRQGDVIYLTNEIPVQWKNTGSSTAVMLWIKIK